MIGHFLLAISSRHEDRILTGHMSPLRDKLHRSLPGPCLLMTAHGNVDTFRFLCTMKPNMCPIGTCYDQLCIRFGAPRVNAAIRNRILSNRARRILQNAPVSRDTVVDTESVGACRFGRGE